MPKVAYRDVRGRRVLPRYGEAFSDEGRVVGIISERDYARKVILMGKSSVKTPVSDIMTRDVIYIEEDAQVNECMALMTAKKVRHLPVLDDDELVGMISVGDLVKTIIDDQTFVIDQLERYIKGEAPGALYTNAVTTRLLPRVCYRAPATARLLPQSAY
jgi:predicted transcriptional regulator